MPKIETTTTALDLTEADTALLLDALELWAAIGQEGDSPAAEAQAEAALALAARFRGALAHPPIPDRSADQARTLLARALAKRVL